MTIHFTKHSASKSPMFFLHSSASNGGQWIMLAEAFKNERDVFTPNLPGYGPVSGNIDNSLMGIAVLASPIIEQIEAQMRPVHLVGHSFGGAVALHIALHRPELIESLSIYEPASFHILKSGNSDQQRAFSDVDQLANALSHSIKSGSATVGMERFIDFWNGSGCWESFSNKKRAIMVELAGTVLSNFDDGKIERWSLEDLNELEVPTLMMEGGLSPSVSRQVTAAIAGAISGVMVATFDQLGHMAPATSPEKLFPVIRDHISIVEQLAMDQVWPLQSAA